MIDSTWKILLAVSLPRIAAETIYIARIHDADEPPCAQTSDRTYKEAATGAQRQRWIDNPNPPIPTGDDEGWLLNDIRRRPIAEADVVRRRL
jgi:hypothetical protein